MPHPLPDDALRTRGLAVLEEQLGPVRALRFLALLSREPFDDQRWRDEYFAGKGLAEILSSARRAPGRKPSRLQSQR